MSSLDLFIKVFIFLLAGTIAAILFLFLILKGKEKKEKTKYTSANNLIPIEHGNSPISITEKKSAPPLQASLNTKNDFCRFCRKELPKGSVFCKYCGNRIEIESSTPVVQTIDERKLKQAYGTYNSEHVSKFFPGGLKQASLIIKSLAAILQINLSKCSREDYQELLNIYSEILIRLIITQDASDLAVERLYVKHQKYIKSELQAKTIIAFVDLHMKDISFDALSKENMALIVLLRDTYERNKEIEHENQNAEKMNLNDYEYGLVVNKPIYTHGVGGSQQYLNSLHSLSDEKLTWNRKGAIAVEGINGMIDIYVSYLPNGREYQTVYVNMYGTKNSDKIPAGFIR